MSVVGTTAYSTAGEAFSLIRSMLNDADIPNIFTIPVSGAVRFSNVVTITLSQPHGLQLGNIVQIDYVTDSSFVGTQTVTTVPAPNVFTYAQIAADATSGNGTVSRIVQGDVWMDAVLIPFVNKGIRKVGRRLRSNGSPTAVSEVELTLAADAFWITDASDPQLPTDFLSPRIIKQRITGQEFYGSEIPRVNVLPSQAENGLITAYSWFDDGIHITPATNQLDVLIRYNKGPLTVSGVDSQITIRDGLDIVSDYAAYLAANSRIPGAGDRFLQLYNDDMTEYLNDQAHARQYLGGRRRGYNRNARSGNTWLGTTV